MAKKKAKAAGAKKKTLKTARTQVKTRVRVKKTKKKAAKKSKPSLGRPKVTGEEILDMLFHDDFHARQVFKFLNVHTVKELEEYTPQQIFKLLSKPMSDAVNSIRKRLAQKNRYLLDDADYAVEYQAKQSETP